MNGENWQVFNGLLESGPKSPKDWAEVYKAPVLYPKTFERGCKNYELRTGDPLVARRVRRKKGFTELVNKVLWSPFPQWYFQAEFSCRRNAIRSLSRILRMPCGWDEERWEIKAIPAQEAEMAMASGF